MWARASTRVALVVAVFGIALLAATVAPSAAATRGSGCPSADRWTAVDFVYSGNYRKTGLYEWAFITNARLGEAVESEFGLTEKEAYFFGVESFGFVDRNGNQILCVSYLGANAGQEDFILSVVDDNANS
jgi:hypothetical protein